MYVIAKMLDFQEIRLTRVSSDFGHLINGNFHRHMSHTI